MVLLGLVTAWLEACGFHGSQLLTFYQDLDAVMLIDGPFC